MPLLEDLEIYEKIARNAKCPCGSGRVFKNCCMQEYREAKKNRPKAIVSSFSPMPLLNADEKVMFPEFYIKLMIFSHQYKYNSDIVFIDGLYNNMQGFIAKERDYFYENKEKIIDKYIKDKNPTQEELLILEAIKNADYGLFFLLSHAKYTAIVVSTKETYYNIQTLNSSFDETFKDVKKYIGLKTAVISYKNCYISDGIYHEFSVDKDMEKVLDYLPYKNPTINYKKDSVVINVPVIMNFSFFTDISQFEKMEEILLKKVPKAFAQGLIDFLDDSYFYNKKIIGSFLRSLDLNEDLNFEEGKLLFSKIIGGISVLNFERGNLGDVIPYSTLEPLYQQKELSQSASKLVYEHVEKYKKSPSKSEQQISTYYTMIGIVHIDREKAQEFQNYLECFNQIEERTLIMNVLHNLCAEINEKEKISITPLFLGANTDLDSIYNEIEEYRAYEKKLGGITLEDAYDYSITKGV